MKSLRYRRRRRGAFELNMTPLIDMVFILLIFFLATTSFVKEAGVEVDRPTAATARDKQVNVVIAVTAEGEVHLDRRVVDIRSVRAHMERFLADTPEGSVVIAADQASRSGVVIRVLDACRLAGVRNISVAARKLE